MERGADRHFTASYGDMDVVSHRVVNMNPSMSTRQINEFVKKLEGWALLEHEIVVLVERFVFNKTFAEITEDHGFVDPRTTHKVYKSALSKAEKGYTYFREGQN